MPKPSIIVIGKNTLDDYITLEKVADYFLMTGRESLALRITTENVDDYDMATKPTKGDAFDAITWDTELVIALHLYGMGMLPGRDPLGADDGYQYCRDNQRLLQRCMTMEVPLVVWGDQPWLGVQRRTQIHENMLYIYEPRMYTVRKAS